MQLKGSVNSFENAVSKNNELKNWMGVIWVAKIGTFQQFSFCTGTVHRITMIKNIIDSIEHQDYVFITPIL